MTVSPVPVSQTSYEERLSGLGCMSVWGWDGETHYDLSQAPQGQNVLLSLNGYWLFCTRSTVVTLP